MITLTLLHPVQGTAVQSWSFHHDQNVRIGRAVDNEVVLYSAVVSRYHVELRHDSDGWAVYNLGVNGTFLEGRKIESEPLQSGQIIRLARSGPNIRVEIDDSSESSIADSNQQLAKISSAPPPKTDSPDVQGESVKALTPKPESDSPSPDESLESEDVPCSHERTPNSSLICIDCGEPVQVLFTIGSYKILKDFEGNDTTFQAWKHKRTYILRTAPSQLFGDPASKKAFTHQLQQAETLNHGGIPRMIEILEHEGRCFLVYEMVYGLSLHRWIGDRGVLSVPAAIAWVTEIARIVEYLHQLDSPFIHQGINPKTIIRPTIPQGSHSLMLVNFGQYKHLIPRESQTNTDLAYCSPLQQSDQLSVNLDLYALGATFLFMLTGSDPYKFMQLGDSAYVLEVDSSHDIPQNVLDLIGRLLQTQDSTPIESATEAIDQLVHLI